MLRLQDWARELGFSQIGVAEVDLGEAEAGLRAWLEAGFHGSMDYMAAHGMKRARPAELHPGALRVITARMDYLPASRASVSVCLPRQPKPERVASSTSSTGAESVKQRWPSGPIASASRSASFCRRWRSTL